MANPLTEFSKGLASAVELGGASTVLVDGRKRSYREVGEELGVTAEAARRLVKRAVNAVREQAALLVTDAA